MTGRGPQIANPAFRFGVQQGEKFGAVGDPEWSQTSSAAAIGTRVNLPTRDHFAAISRLFQESGAAACLGMDKVDSRDARKQLSVC